MKIQRQEQDAGSRLDRDYSGAQDIYKKYSFDEEKYKHGSEE